MNIEIVLTPTTGPIDEPLHAFVRGLPPGECVTIRAQLRDSRDTLRRSHLTLRAGPDGVATLDADALIASLTVSPNDSHRPFDTTSGLPLVVEFMAEYAGRVVANAGHLMRPPGVPTSILEGQFALGGTPQEQAAANRAAWSETVAFLRESLARSSFVAAATTGRSSACR